MKTENRYFDIHPRVVPAGRRTTVTIHPRFAHAAFQSDKTYEIHLFPAEYYPAASREAVTQTSASPQDGSIEVIHLFEDEQEYILEILDPSAPSAPPLLRTLLYSIEADLYGLLPLKGDLHLHSFHSDGKESPGFVAAACRRVGFDFMALTDHGQYAPSLEAQAAFADVDADLLICPGEEIHPPDNPVHMVNFGSGSSVNELISGDRDAYFQAVRQIEQKLADVQDGDTRYQLASCIWVFDQIRQGDGLGIFCHPYWHVRWGYTPAEPVTAALFARQPFDAYEVLGGYARDAVDSNILQVARYHEERSKGREIPIVGVSDGHGCENSDLFGWYYTLVFADNPSQASIIDSIGKLRSVAVEAIPGESVRAYGPLRLVKYALFLIAEVLPGHDEICREEGLLMLDCLAGRREARDELSAKQGRTIQHLNRYTGKT